MARPPIDPASRIAHRLEPPAELKAARRKLWHREFDRFPPGYYVESDVRGMLLYLDWIAIYDRTLRAATRAKGEAALAWASELRQVAAKVITLQRALRMYPSTRAREYGHGALARNAPPPPTPGRQAWEDLMPPPPGKRPAAN